MMHKSSKHFLMKGYVVDIIYLNVIWVVCSRIFIWPILGGRCESIAITDGLHLDTVSRREQISFCSTSSRCT